MSNKFFLIIGYGNAGKRYYRIAKKYYNKSSILIVTKQKKKPPFYNSFKDIVKKPIEGIIIANNTEDHAKTLREIEANLKGVKILVEKPMFNNFSETSLNIKKNSVYIGYNLRMHPVINFMKKICEKKKIIRADIVCKTFIPLWRKNKSWKRFYSFDEKKGGGVLKELTHEIDYTTYLMGKLFFDKYRLEKKNKNYNINDYFKAHASSKKCKDINIELDLFEKKESRFVKLITKKNIYIGDLKNSKVFINNEKLHNKKINNFKIETTYEELFKEVFFKRKKKYACNFFDAISFEKKTLKLL